MPLDQQQTLSLKTQLRDRAALLREDIQRVLERSGDESHAQIAERARDAEDDSFSNLIVDLNLADIERDAEELRLIGHALTRLKSGVYGECTDCGQTIPFARLQAEPTATRCVNCQELYEKTHATARTPSL